MTLQNGKDIKLSSYQGWLGKPVSAAAAAVQPSACLLTLLVLPGSALLLSFR